LPLFEYRCRHCSKIEERFFHSFEESELPQRHSCYGKMDKIVSRVTFNAFQPFVTNHIRPDGAPVQVNSRNQLSDLMKRYNLVESRTNHCQYGGDVRSIPLSGEPTGSVRKPRRNSKVNHFTPQQAEKASEQARRANYGMG
jgi:hypothetical protein